MNLLILFCHAIVKGKKKICYDNIVLNPVKKKSFIDYMCDDQDPDYGNNDPSAIKLHMRWSLIFMTVWKKTA